MLALVFCVLESYAVDSVDEQQLILSRFEGGTASRRVLIILLKSRAGLLQALCLTEGEFASFLRTSSTSDWDSCRWRRLTSTRTRQRRSRSDLGEVDISGSIGTASFILIAGNVHCSLKTHFSSRSECSPPSEWIPDSLPKLSLLSVSCGGGEEQSVGGSPNDNGFFFVRKSRSESKRSSSSSDSVPESCTFSWFSNGSRPEMD